MTTSCDNTLVLGYDLDVWNGYGEKRPVAVDISPSTNSHMLICGMSGSGKSYETNALIAKLAMAESQGEFYFADYKGEDSFSYLRDCPRYWSYKNTLDALDAVYSRLNARLAGEDESRNPITLIWDEYMANILSLVNEDKKGAAVVMNKVSEILLMGRSMSIRLITSMQRPDALAFPAGARLNYGVVIVLGAAIKSIYEMLLPDFLDEVKGRQFGRGEGVALLQGSDLRFIKVPMVRDTEKMRQLCINALTPNANPTSGT
ncbi:MAG: FtsK/SpoIIIE domain-containing protein [Christensenellaceae bacterium]